MKKIFNFSFMYLILGLALGVFHREFTKMNGFEGVTVLSAVHTHTLILGFIFLLVVLLLDKNFNISSEKMFDKWFILHNVALIYVVTAMVVRGVLQVTGGDMPGLNHIAGLGHAMLGISLIWFMVIAKKKIVK
ncbi:MAG: DUF2871 domain-containing protein [Clostridium sp.]